MAFRHKSFRLPEEDAESDIGSDFSGRRKNHKFKTISGDGRPLGDREMLLKKKKASEQDLSYQGGKTDLDEELGSGLFDRFSSSDDVDSRQREEEEGRGQCQPWWDAQRRLLCQGERWLEKPSGEQVPEEQQRPVRPGGGRGSGGSRAEGLPQRDLGPED